MNRRLRLLRSLRWAAALLLLGTASARPGDLDLSFNAAGTNSPPGSVATTSASLTAFSLLPDGKILTVGPPTTFRRAVTFTRWLPDGRPDLSFGDAGLVSTDPETPDFSSVSAMATHPDGRITVVIFSGVAMALRFSPDGALDHSFGNNGAAIFSEPGFIDSPYAVAALPGGKTLFAGYSSPLMGGGASPRLRRLMPDGNPDQTFGSGGIVTLPFPATVARAIALRDDGKIVLTGWSSPDGITRGAWLARCEPDGSLDRSFGNDGSVTLPLLAGGRETSALHLVLQSDGKIVFGGSSGPLPGVDLNYGFFLARYHADGSPDLTFNGTGSLLTDPTPQMDAFFALALQSDGKILAAGMASNQMVVARYLTSGLPDNEFGAEGIAKFTAASSAGSMLLQPNGRILLGGNATNSDPQKLVFVQCLDRDPSASFAAEWPAGTALSDGGAVHMGTAVEGDVTPRDTIITLRNTGATPLRNLSASISGAGASRFSLLSGPAMALGGGESTNIAVRFVPDIKASQFSAALTIESGGPDKPSFVAVLRGGTDQPIAALTLLENGTPVAPNTAVNFGTTMAAQPVSRFFTIKNGGNIPLLLQGVSLGTLGTPGDFTVSPLETDALAPGASTAFQVTFAPAGYGPRTATLRIASTDTLNPPFEITLTGTGHSHLDVWRFTHFNTLLNEGTAADLADPDHDGAVNLMEYATLTHPLQPDAFSAELTLSGDTLEYTFSRPSAATDHVRYTIERNLNLSLPWIQSTDFTILSDDGTRQQVKASITAGLTRRFLRLRVTKR